MRFIATNSIFAIFAILSLAPTASATIIPPFSTTKPTYESVPNPLSTPSELWSSDFKAPYQTNAFYMNLVLGSGINPINMLPYIIEVEPQHAGLGIGVPTQQVFSQTYVMTPYVKDWELSSVEGAFDSHSVSAADKLSLTLEFLRSTNSKLTFPLVHGSAFITGQFQNATPSLTTQHAILTVTLADGSTHTPGDTVTSQRLIVSLNSNRSWIVYTSAPVQFTIEGSALKAASTFTGSLRLAILGQEANLGVEELHSSAQVYDKYKDTIPVSGAVDYEFNGDNANYSFTYTTLDMKCNCQSSEANSDLLLYALQHHMDTLVSPVLQSSLTIQTIKGKMTAVAGSKWTMQEKLTTMLFDAPRDYTNSDWKEAVRAALKEDASYKPDAGDPYFFGTQIGKLARLALIADSLQETDIASSIRANLKAALIPWLEQTNSDPLKYDETWGGICAKAGLADKGADFGQGLYNDHHFHYGYHVYAAATILKQGDADFLSKYKEQILYYVRDYANPNPEDPYFPVTRHKDWFNGHSWASGLFEFGDNRNQESTSEAFNAYYAIALLGKAMNDDNMYNFGRLLLATEIRSAKKYWHIMNESDVYPDEFKGNKMVGVLWDTKVDYTTWFGAQVEFIHGIQMLPYTPITQESLDYSFVQQEYDIVKGAGADAWKTYMIMDGAIINQQDAWQELNAAVVGDWAGNSKTNALWWIATRPASGSAQDI